MSRALRTPGAILLSYAAGFIGSLSMRDDWASWYDALAKPPLTPPEWVFFPIWMILYGLMGLALGLMWGKTGPWHAWVGCFLVSLAFNAAWTIFFFGLRVVLIALIDILCLAMILIALILGAWELNRAAAYLLAPYLAWVLFATYLNAGIWVLN